MADVDIMTNSPVILRPDASRTVIRPFAPGDPPAFAVKGHPRAQRIADRVLALDGAHVREELARVIAGLTERHRDVESHLLRRFDEVKTALDSQSVSHDQSLLIGAYFSAEFSFEAAALFNPSIVLHRNQSDLPPNTVRFVMSLRGIGEGHVSSVTFRTGTWSPGKEIVVDPSSALSVPPIIEMPEGKSDGSVILLRCGERL